MVDDNHFHVTGPIIWTGGSMRESTDTCFTDRIIQYTSMGVKRSVFLFLSLTALCFIIYANSLDVPFQFDDRPNLLENRAIHMKHLGLDSIITALLSSEVSKTRAIPMLSFALNWYYGGIETYGYHVVNIVIHILTAFFLFQFLYQLIRLPIFKESYASCAFSVAIISTFLWCVNPLQTQAVTYIVQRMASMATLFYIVSMHLYLKARIDPSNGRKVFFFSLCGIASLLSLFSKENAVTLPIALALLEILFIKGVSKQNIKNMFKPVLLILLTAVLMGIMVLSLNDRSIFSIFGGYSGRPFTLMERLLTQPRIICFYISLLLYPSPDRLTIGHDIAFSTGLFTPYTTFLSILFIAGSIGVAIGLSKKRPLIAFCILFFFLNHAVESSFIPLEMIFEHRNYLPSITFFVPLAILLARGIAYYEDRRFMKGFICIFIICLLMGQGYGTYTRNFAWQTPKSLWLDAIAKAPAESRNHVNYAIECFHGGEHEKALYHLEIATHLGNYIKKKYEPHTYTAMGDTYLAMGRLEKAIEFYNTAVDAAPYPEAYNNMAMAYKQKGDLDSARRNLMRSLYFGETAEAHNNLGHILLLQGETRKAVTEFEKALQINNSLSGVYINLGIAFKKLGQYKKALNSYKMSLYKNQNPDPLSNGRILSYLGLIEIQRLLGDEEGLRDVTDRFLFKLVSRRAFDRLISHFEDPDALYRVLGDASSILSAVGDGYYRFAGSMEAKGKDCFSMAKDVTTD